MITSPATAASRSALARQEAQRKRQDLVLGLYLSGLSSAEIADHLAISRRTVQRDLVELGDARVRAEEIITEAGIDSHDAWITLSRMHDADIADILDERGDVKPLREWPAVWRQGLAGEVVIEDIMERSADGGNTSWDKTGGKRIRIKRESLLKIVELAMRHKAVDAMADKGGDFNVTINVTAERAREVAAARKRLEAAVIDVTPEREG